MAVEDHPDGGYVKSYEWDFYDKGIIPNHIGTYTTSNEIVRESSDVDINGVRDSVWDIRSFNEYEKFHSFGDLSSMVTRMSAEDYANQKLLSYGPKTDTGFTVPVTLNGKVATADWTFEVGNTYVGNSSSTSNKYGRWSYSLGIGAPEPFITEPGMRISNTKGAFALQISNTFNVYMGKHQTGTVTIILPDR